MIGTIALVPQIADATRIPVVASGGVMDGRGIAAALAFRSHGGADGHGLSYLRRGGRFRRVQGCHRAGAR